MFSGTKIAAGLAGVASMFLIAGNSLSAVSASAADTDASACTLQGAASVAGLNLTPPPAPNVFGNFNGVSITCHPPFVTGNDDGGVWTDIAATFHTDAAGEFCGGGNGSGFFTAGTAPNGSSGDGVVVSGDGNPNDDTSPPSVNPPPETFPLGPSEFYYYREGSAVTVLGNIATSNGETHQFRAALQFVPVSGPCVNDPSHPTFATLIGSAHVTE